MKAITLHQPWASLIAVGAKKIETRSWRPPDDLIGQTIAIHAGKKIVNFGSGSSFNRAVTEHLGAEWLREIPRGAMLCTATLADAEQMNFLNRESWPEGHELLFGEYGISRWMWRLENIAVFDPPVPARGHQQFWNWEDETE